MMERFADEMEQEVGLRRCGYLFMLDREADLAQFRANVALQNSLGVPSRVVSAAEIAELAPEVDIERNHRRHVVSARRPRRSEWIVAGLRVERATARRDAAHRHAGDRHRRRPAEACVASSRTRGRSTHRPSSSPRARGRRRSARWPESTCRFSRFGDRSRSPEPFPACERTFHLL